MKAKQLVEMLPCVDRNESIWYTLTVFSVSVYIPVFLLMGYLELSDVLISVVTNILAIPIIFISGYWVYQRVP